jgi:hypothetical protein
LSELDERRNCPICGDKEGPVLVDLPYDREPISGYLRAFYAGRLDPSFVEGERYGCCSIPHLLRPA